MSNLRDKAREIKSAGEAERGNFQPTGAPLRLYNYWLSRTRSKKGKAIRYGERRENFCHFWRVVAIWAPLMGLRKGAEKVAPYVAALVALGALITLIVAMIVSKDVLATVGIVAAGAVVFGLLVWGLFSGFALAVSESRARDLELPDRKAAKIGFILGFPTAIVAFGISKGVQFYGNHLTDYNKQIALGAVALGVVLFYGGIGYANGLGWMLVWILGTAAVIGAGFLAILGISFIADYVSGKRKVAEKQAELAAVEYYEQHGHFPHEAPREPSRLEMFFRGIGDFIVFIGQIVRVNKWKICPLVEVKTD